MTRYCLACGAGLVIGNAAAWPERCPHCGTAPLATTSGGFAAAGDHSASRRLDVLERDAPHLIAPIEPRDV